MTLPYERSSQYPYQHSGTEVAMSPGMQWLDPLVTLVDGRAAVTDRVRLGTSVLVLPYRNPVNLAAEAAALDVLSDGRFVLGVGAGWMQEEFRALGIDPGASAAPRTDEHIEVLRTLWTQDPAELRRPLHELRRHRARDHSAHRGRAADLGGRQHRCRRCAGRCGSATAGTASRSIPEDMPDVHERLARLGEEVGRDPGELELSVVRGLIPPGREEESFIPERRMLGGSADAIVDELGCYAEQGVEDVVIQVSLLAPLVPEALEWVAAEVLPKLLGPEP